MTRYSSVVLCCMCGRQVFHSSSVREGICGICVKRPGKPISREGWEEFPDIEFTTGEYAALHGVTVRTAYRRLKKLSCVKRKKILCGKNGRTSLWGVVA